MITFLIALALLVIGYFTYGKIMERVFRSDERLTPAVTMADGVDDPIGILFALVCAGIFFHRCYRKQ